MAGQARNRPSMSPRLWRRDPCFQQRMPMQRSQLRGLGLTLLAATASCTVATLHQAETDRHAAAHPAR